jgi:hypothetical protein
MEARRQRAGEGRADRVPAEVLGAEEPEVVLAGPSPISDLKDGSANGDRNSFKSSELVQCSRNQLILRRCRWPFSAGCPL